MTITPMSIYAYIVLSLHCYRLYSIWSKAEKKVKFGGGFYCGALSPPGGATIYVFNPFFMDLRSKFIAPTASIRYYSVEFDPTKLSWAKFRGTGSWCIDPSIDE